MKYLLAIILACLTILPAKAQAQSGLSANRANLALQAARIRLHNSIVGTELNAPFDWSPVSEHQKAAVRVSCGSAAGSGTYVQHQGVLGVITCAHLYDQGGPTACKVTFSDGSVKDGTITVDKDGHDIAFIPLTHSSFTPLNIATSLPKPGERLEYVTYGGPQNKLRHFYVTTTSHTDTYLSTDGDVTYGDSGGGWLNLNHELVGVQSTGSGLPKAVIREGGSNWDVFDSSNSASTAKIQLFMGRVAAKFGNAQVQIGNCPGGSCPSPQSPRQGGSDWLYPPENQPIQPPPITQPQYPNPPPITQPGQPQPQQPQCQPCPCQGGDCPCDKGPACECDQATIAEALKKQNEAIASLLGNINQNSSKLAELELSVIELNNAVASIDSKHIVVVADRSAPYWDRLAVQIERTKQRYSGIRIAPPPAFATELPALVVYRNRVSILEKRGEREVYRLLAELERGNSSILE